MMLNRQGEANWELTLQKYSSKLSSCSREIIDIDLEELSTCIHSSDRGKALKQKIRESMEAFCLIGHGLDR